MTKESAHCLYKPRQVGELLGLSTSTLNQYRSFDIGVRNTELTSGGHYRYKRDAVIELAFAQQLLKHGLTLEMVGAFLFWKGHDLVENASLPSEWKYDNEQNLGRGQAFLIVRLSDVTEGARREWLNWNASDPSISEEKVFTKHSDCFRVASVSTLADIERITSTSGVVFYPNMILRQIPENIYDLPAFERS